MRLLLDTHIILWALAEDDRLPPGVKRAIEDPSNHRAVSIASYWELTIKRSLGKLDTTVGLGEIAARVRDDLRARVLPVRVEHLLTLERLPWHHRDPFDRLILAQAETEGFTVATVDACFDTYGLPILRR